MNKQTLQQYIEGNSTPKEKEEVAKWLDADEKNMQEFLLLRGVYDATLWNKTNTLYLKQEQGTRISGRRKRILNEFLKIAAVFILAIGSYHLYLMFADGNANDSLQTVFTPGGQRAEIVLSDGTKVWLNAKSRIIFPNQFNKSDRVVELTGEAYFEVARDEKKHFIVRTDAYHIKVHGTEFDVYAYNDKFEASLIEGSVEVISNSTNQSLMLLPGTRVYNDNNMLVTTQLDGTDRFLWKNGVLSFENQCVRDIIDKLELYYDVKVEVTKKDLLDYKFTGKFWINDGIEHFFKVLQLRHDFKYTKDDLNNITIY